MREVWSGRGHGHRPPQPHRAAEGTRQWCLVHGTTRPGDVRVLADEEQELLDVDEDGAAGQAAEQEDEGGTLQDHPHAQQVLAAVGLQGERAVSSAACRGRGDGDPAEHRGTLTSPETAQEGFGVSREGQSSLLWGMSFPSSWVQLGLRAVPGHHQLMPENPMPPGQVPASLTHL